jgi:hypothetical protein
MVVDRLAIASRLWSNWRLHQDGGETGDCFKTVERLVIAAMWWRDWLLLQGGGGTGDFYNVGS